MSSCTVVTLGKERSFLFLRFFCACLLSCLSFFPAFSLHNSQRAVRRWCSAAARLCTLAGVLPFRRQLSLCAKVKPVIYENGMMMLVPIFCSTNIVRCGIYTPILYVDRTKKYSRYHMIFFLVLAFSTEGVGRTGAAVALIFDRQRKHRRG